MTNFEKYQKELAEIAVNSAPFGLLNGVPTQCNLLSCGNCDWYNNNCIWNIKNWVNQKYEEPKIQSAVENLKVDDKVLVSDDGKRWRKRHFHHYDLVTNTVYAFDDGGTSWTTNASYPWKYAKLPEVGD